MAEEIKTEENFHLENIAQFHDALKDLQEDLSNEEIIEKLSKVTKEDIEYIKTNPNLSKEENTNKIVLDEDSKINEKLLRLLAISGSLGEQGIIQATQTLQYTELGQLFAIKEFGELIVQTAKFGIALSKAVGKEISTGIDSGISDYNNNKEIENIITAREALAIQDRIQKENKAEINTETKKDNKEVEHKVNINPGENVEINIDKVKVKIVTDYIPIKERKGNIKNQTKDNDIQR